MKPLVNEVKDILQVARKTVAVKVNDEIIATYWKIGEIIVRYEQNDNFRAAYGERTLKQVSKELTKAFGKGFSQSNVYNMRLFYLTYEKFQTVSGKFQTASGKFQSPDGKCQTVSGKLSWSHYCELLSISDGNKRSFYEHEAQNSHWSVREMKRQIETSLYERLILSKGEANKEEVYKLATKGIEMSAPIDIIKDPYVFEFLGIPENKPIMENDLEKTLVEQMGKFLLELGRGFMFVGTQQRVTINNTHYYVDMVFYNKPLKSYVLIELKTTKLMPEAAGQLNMYLNYYEKEVNDQDDAKPIGIILCTDKDALTAEYVLGGLANNIFASKYTQYIPEKEMLIAETEKIVEYFT